MRAFVIKGGFSLVFSFFDLLHTTQGGPLDRKDHILVSTEILLSDAY